MGATRRWVSLYGRLIYLHMRSQFEFPWDFWIGILGSCLKQATGLIFRLFRTKCG